MRNKALIFLNGDLTDPIFIKKLVTSETYLIGCDGGADHIYKLGLKPHVVVGDFDSVKNLPAEIKNLTPKKISGQKIVIDDITYLKYPFEKDFTDSELAIDFAAEKDFKEIVLVNHLGNETDHMLGIIFLLAKEKYAGINIKIIQANQDIFVVSDEVEIEGKPGQKISLIPLFGEVKVKSSSGLKYDPAKYKMSMQANSGISNEFSKKEAKLKITAGKFLAVIHK